MPFPLNRNRATSALNMDEVNPLPLIVVGAVIILALVLVGRRRGANAAQEAAHTANESGRKMLLSFAINALENDMARRAIIMGLKMARSRM